MDLEHVFNKWGFWAIEFREGIELESFNFVTFKIIMKTKKDIKFKFQN